MAPATSKRRSTRQAIGRKRSLYVDPDTDDDFEANTSDGEADYQPEPATAPERPQKRRKVAAAAAITKTRRPTTRSKASNTKAAPKKRQTKIIGHARKPRSTAVDKAEAGKFRGPSDGKTPEWTSLPLSILNDIFVLASQPLDGDNVAWLHKAAHTCRAFGEPALQAYYHAPLIQHTLHPHHLLELMRIRQGRLFNYNAKVRRLEIDMRRLSYTAHNRALFNLSELVAELPQLQHLEITNPIDVPPYRRMKTQQWYYPTDLFSTLENGGQRLKSWRWSRDMHNEDMDVDMFPYMASIHEGKAFEHLTDLTICGYDVHDSPPTIINDPTTNEETVLDLPWALSKLPSLKSLTFISCDIVRDDFLTALPRTLHRLTLTNCWKLTSSVLTTFLQTHGAHLTHLSLNHNVTLNLAFLPVLATSCPRLQSLSVDGHYYSERVSINDAEPEYEQLLDTTSLPTWPSSLRFVELIHLQKWSSEAATNFFRSLASSAPDLPDLRVLRLQAHINIPWRDRAGFRDQWIERLQATYLRRSAPPNPYHGSKKQFALLQSNLAAQAQRQGKVVGEVGMDEDEDELAALMHPRALSHVAPSPHKPSGDTDAYDSDAAHSPPATRRRSTRVAHQESRSHSPTPGADDIEHGSPAPATGVAEDEAEVEFVQGLCTVVDVRIDNQRPRENLFTENDFLDSEVSGDEDWDEGVDMEFEDRGYAW